MGRGGVRGSLWRTRWAAIGAAVAVAVGAGGVVRWAAADSSAPSSFVAVTPVRVLDTRDPTNLGLAGPFVSPAAQDLTVTGEIFTSSGPRTVVPAGATGVVLNVTVVQPTLAGFVSVRPADAPGAPATSSLNFEAGVTQPNAVTVQVPISGPDAGKIEIAYDAYGTPNATTEVLIDIVGYYTTATIAPAPVARTETLNLPYSSFFPLTSETGDYSGGSGKLGGSAGRYMVGTASNAGGSRMMASVQLPQGATITGVEAGLYKNASPGPATIELRRIDKTAAAPYDVDAVAEADLTGSAPTVRTFSAPVDVSKATVDNSRYIYVFTVLVGGWHTTNQIDLVWGSVTYTYLD